VAQQVQHLEYTAHKAGHRLLTKMSLAERVVRMATLQTG